MVGHRNRQTTIVQVESLLRPWKEDFKGEIKCNYRRTYQCTDRNDSNNSIVGDGYVKSNNDDIVANNRDDGARKMSSPREGYIFAITQRYVVL